MSKIAVAVYNRKGGVGKTTLAVILAELALIRHSRILGIDLDPSGNFTTAFNFLRETPYRDSFRIKNTLEDSDADSPEEWIVIDCSPILDDVTKHAIDFADITVLPVRPDYFSISPLGMITAMAERQYHKSRSQLPIVKVGFDTSAMAKVANQIINDGGYPIAEELPMHKGIPYNISSGRIWSMGLTARSRQPYESLYRKINLAVNRLLEGKKEFHEVWSGGESE